MLLLRKLHLKYCEPLVNIFLLRPLKQSSKMLVLCSFNEPLIVLEISIVAILNSTPYITRDENKSNSLVNMGPKRILNLGTFFYFLRFNFLYNY